MIEIIDPSMDMVAEEMSKEITINRVEVVITGHTSQKITVT